MNNYSKKRGKDSEKGRAGKTKKRKRKEAFKPKRY